ncbi:cyclin-dependent kinase 20 isoform X2 [Fopius arisanus]|uniref:Cyclin-dependent kinase 20 n=1 Tax=Fopius arisanus TaxID=64838 RepID=A0A0C9QF89_9HYME|nr:PREDICTED: cyclin-dependent kinase 20 isoform X2 [Fopius arisanus]
MENYTVTGRIGEGAHGLVVKAIKNETGNEVALKKVLLKRINDGLPVSIIREVKTLQEMNHPFDLKPANLLIDPSGVLKIADFGLARLTWEEYTRPYSQQVATRWYRAPELLYGSKLYSSSIDMWSVGCIIAEIINNSPLFPGDSDIEQLAMVLRQLGTPTVETWPDLHSLPDYNKITFPYQKGMLWEEVIPDATSEALHIIRNMLVYNSSSRLTANDALKQKYFYTRPYACIIQQLPKPPHNHRSLLRPNGIDVFGRPTIMFKGLIKLT